MKRPKSEEGITLIELLVCLGIISILAAILLPANRGRRSGLGVCLVNQKQLAINALLYQGDNKGVFPNLDTLPGNDGPVALSLLTNYSARWSNLFMCPFVVGQREKERPWYRDKFVPVLDAGFFRSNGNDYAYYDGALTNSSTNAFIADRLAWTNRTSTNLLTWGHANGRINAAFVDGHAENLRADLTVGKEYNPAWSATQDPVLK